MFLAFYATLNLFGFRFFNRMTALNFELWDDGRDEGATLWTMIGIVIALVAVVQLVGRNDQRSAIPNDLDSGQPAGDSTWRPTGSGERWASASTRLICSASSSSRCMVLFLLAVGDIILVVAASMDGLSTSDFAISARAKGLTDRQVRERHAGRVAMLPALSRLTANLPFALGGLVIIEASFGRLGGYRIDIPGVASILFGSLRQRNLLLTLGAWSWSASSPWCCESASI